MNTHVVIDGRQHPDAAKMLAYLESMPPMTVRQHTRSRTLQVLHMHLLHGSAWRTHVTPEVQMWLVQVRHRVRTGLASEPARKYWDTLNQILAQPPGPPLPPREVATKKQEAVAELVVQLPEQAQPQWNRDQRYDLRALDQPDILSGNDPQRATTIWWHYLFVLREKHTNGWRHAKDREARALKDPNLRVFVNMQRELLASGVLTQQQAELVKLLLGT